MKKRTKIAIIILSVVAIAIGIYFIFFNTGSIADITVSPKQGKFIISVTSSGELKAEKSTDVRGPQGAKALGIYDLTISDLVEEGTVVKEGDIVAELDKTPIMTKIKEGELSVLKYQSQYEQAQIDTTLNLSRIRDNLENLKFAMEEQKLQMEQSKYEPPAVIKQAKINLEKAERQYKQAVKNYTSEVQKAVTNLTIVGADLSRGQAEMAKLMQVMQDFSVKAPADGMVIYRKDWNGNKTTVGSRVSSWNPVVASLPDLTKMQSITYINEIDISKIKKDQEVIIRLDAVSDKELKGKVISVANIGEDLGGSDSKVFETIIEVSEKDTTLLPAMTTSNEIIIQTIENALFIPQECVHVFENDSTKFNYVIKKDGVHNIRQEVELGEFNDNDVVIKKGLTLEDELLLSLPEDYEEIEIKRLEPVTTTKEAK